MTRWERRPSAPSSTSTCRPRAPRDVRVLLGFGHSRDPRQAHTAPSVKRFEREFVKFRARYPWIRDYLTWNEANHCSQPTCRNPERAAQYYLALRKHCPGCRIVAADVLDGSKLTRWVKRVPEGASATAA